MSLPTRGPWVVTPTSSTVDWMVAGAALAATADGTAAAVTLGCSSELLAAHVAALVELPAGTGLDAVTAVVADLDAKHHRVVVLVDAWVAAPNGGWTVADLATAVHAPVVVVTGTDADATGHTMLFLEALDRRQVPGSVIVVGDGGDFDALPVRLAGRIPADHADTGHFAAEAARWIDPLDGSRISVEDHRPVKTAGPEDLQTRIARRAAWTLAISFLLALLLLCLCNGSNYPSLFT
ncbi:hypothetical protein ACFPIJ_06590 [Dactylosporangium cerinum]|uniref:Uncharacterized protein n=1 Tax=Dactylosporangium cerinum TaxID=1434730 RepID=A0ABV9VPZ6_9ACTN